MMIPPKKLSENLYCLFYILKNHKTSVFFTKNQKIREKTSKKANEGEKSLFHWPFFDYFVNIIKF